MSRARWTDAELYLLRELYPDVPAADVAALLDRPVGQVHQAADRYGVGKSAYFHASDRSGRIQRGKQLPSMIASQFKPGFTPWNKGRQFDSGGRSHETRFQSGSRPHTWLPVGSYRITTTDQALERKVCDVPGASHKRWTPVARIVWEQAHGPIPHGHLVVFKPGQKTNVLEQITPDRLECITRGQNAQRNSMHNQGPEMARLHQLKGQITRQVNRITRESQTA